MAFNWIRNKLRNTSNLDVPSGQTEPLKEDPKYNGVASKELWPLIRFAFKSGDKNYFYIQNELNILPMRAYASLDIYRELDYGINPDALIAHCKALKEIPKKSKDITEMVGAIHTLATFLEERIKISSSIDLALSLSTIRYFDENEDISGYDWDYNIEKKKHWMKHHDIPGFFLQLPFQAFITSGKDLDQSLKTSLNLEARVIKSHLELLLSLSESPELNSDTKNSLKRQIETLKLSIDWSAKPAFTNSTFIPNLE